jgi:hypothetical protein
MLAGQMTRTAIKLSFRASEGGSWAEGVCSVEHSETPLGSAPLFLYWGFHSGQILLLSDWVRLLSGWGLDSFSLPGRGHCCMSRCNATQRFEFRKSQF